MVLKWVGTGCKNHEISCVSILLFYSVQHGVLCSDSNSVFQCPIVSFSILLFSSVRGVYGVLQCLWCPTASQWRSVVPVVSMVSYSLSVVFCSVSNSFSVVSCGVCGVYGVPQCLHMVPNSFSVVSCSSRGVLQCLWCPTVSHWCTVVPVVSMVSYSFSVAFCSARGVTGTTEHH